jgi:hypothetical protein
VQQDVFQAGLARIVRDDEAVTLPCVEPFNASGDLYGLGLHIHLFKLVTSHLPLGPSLRPNFEQEPTITLFS